jgi:hypothetical protein
MALFLSTTGTVSTLTLNDLFGRTITHPTTNLEINLEFDIDVIAQSNELQIAITAGHVILKDENNTTITNVSKLIVTQYILDKNLNNISDDSDRFGNQLPAYYLARANHTGTQTSSSISDLSTTINNAIAATNLSGLADVNISSPLNNQVLSYNTFLSKWVPQTISGGGVIGLNDLTDVDTTGLHNKYILSYDQSTAQWRPILFSTLGTGISTNYFERNAAVTSPTVAATWQVRTLEFANAFAFITFYNTACNARIVGIRTVGSTTSRIFTIKNNNLATYTTVTNSSSQIEIYSNNITGVTITVIGYIV